MKKARGGFLKMGQSPQILNLINNERKRYRKLLQRVFRNPTPSDMAD